jgi:predicted O-methyltransferase YrrM
MSQVLHRLLSYLQYRLKAKNEHAFHSPFVYDFVTKVVYTDKTFYAFDTIEKLRWQLQNDHSIIELEELGAKEKGTYTKKVSTIAQQAVLPKKYAQLLFKCIDYFKCTKILEIGTNLGITAAYLASANSKAKVVSIEGNPNLSNLAIKNSQTLGLHNTQIITALFDDSLPTLLNENNFDFIYVDGNHTEAATLRYFDWIKATATENTIVVFDDIYWSMGMTEAWQVIKKDTSISLTLDFYKFGMVFFKSDRVKQDFVVRF